MNKSALIAVGVVTLTAGAYWLFGGDGDGNGVADAPPAPSLRALLVQPQAVTLKEELSGRTVAFKVSHIRPQVSGIIVDRLFKEGGNVEKGQQLYQIDPAVYQAAFDAAQADVQKAEANFEAVESKNRRYKELVKLDAVSKQEYEDIKASLLQGKADVAIAKAALAKAKIDLDYTKVNAPISGIIGKSEVTTGALVTANQSEPLAQVTQLDPIYVDMAQSSADLMRLRSSVDSYENIPVTLSLGDGMGTYAHEGALQFNEVSVDASTSTVTLRAQFPNPDNQLLPGLFVRGSIMLHQPEALLVPQAAATRQPDGSLTIWVAGEDNAVQPVNITVKGAMDGNWIVAEGVKSGDVVITEGLMGLHPGATVNPQLEEKKPDGQVENTENPAPPASDAADSEHKE